MTTNLYTILIVIALNFHQIQKFLLFFIIFQNQFETTRCLWPWSAGLKPAPTTPKVLEQLMIQGDRFSRVFTNSENISNKLLRVVRSLLRYVAASMAWQANLTCIFDPILEGNFFIPNL